LDISLPAQVFVGSNLKKLKEQLKGKWCLNKPHNSQRFEIILFYNFRPRRCHDSHGKRPKHPICK
jgi:hypothetical protein